MDLSSSAFQRGWCPSEQLKWREMEMLVGLKIFDRLFLKSERSFQEFTFPTRSQDETPRNNQRGAKGKCLTRRKTLSGFYWFYEVLQGLHFSPPGSRMGSQGAAKWTKRKMSERWETLATFYWILCSLIRASLFPSGSRMGSQWTTKGTKNKTSEK